MPQKRGNRARGSLRGRGDYTVATKSIKDPVHRLESKIDHLERRLVRDPMSKANAAETIGRTLGNFAGQGDLGALAGSSLAKYFGHGDYKVHTNSLMKGNPVAGASFSKDGKRGTRITEREFIGDIKSGPITGSATDFTVQNFPLNPTNPVTFPWLSKMANLFDQWEPNGIVFEFISTSSEYNGTSQALGAVIMATDYDGYDPVFASKQEMENADYACSTKPANNLLHGIECDPSERPTHILYSSTNNGAPITSTTLGTTQVATQGCSTAGVTLGELWISYDITFYKKQMTNIPSAMPLLTTVGSVEPLGPYFPGVLNSRTITLEQQIGNGTIIHLNNPFGGSKYIMYYFLTPGSEISDESEFTNAVLTGCTRDFRVVRGLNGSMIYMGLYTTNAVSATISIGINSSVSHSMISTITQVSDDFAI